MLLIWKSIFNPLKTKDLNNWQGTSTVNIVWYKYWTSAKAKGKSIRNQTTMKTLKWFGLGHLNLFWDLIDHEAVSTQNLISTDHRL